MIFNLLRMPQNKAIHCYLLMSVWILLLIVGIYKFLEPKQKILESPTVSTELYSGLSVDIKTKRIFKICNFPEEIKAGEEGTFIIKNYFSTICSLEYLPQVANNNRHGFQQESLFHLNYLIFIIIVTWATKYVTPGIEVTKLLLTCSLMKWIILVNLQWK